LKQVAMDDIGVQKEIFVFIKAAPKQIYQFIKKPIS